MVKVIDWRCSNGKCTGVRLAKEVTVTCGWIERKCRSCGHTAHVGNERGNESEIDVRCIGESGYTHILARASADWQGSITVKCDRCKSKTESTIPASSLASEPKRSVAATEPLR